MRDNSIQVFQPGLQVDYWSESYECWAPACVRSVNPETGEVAINARILPLSPEQAKMLLRHRTQPGQRHLQWIAEVLRDGRVESEAQKLFRRHAAREGRAAEAKAATLSQTGLRAVGRELDKFLGVSGSAYELLRRAAKAARGARPALPAGWERRRSESTGREYYACGARTQWERPTASLQLGADGFTAAFWEILVAVDQRWGQVFVYKEKLLADKSEMDKNYSFGTRWVRLGKGTFGSVYLAKHRKTGIRRAVKVIPQDGADDETLTRLDSEIGRLLTLDHPHIVKLYDCYKGGENLYVVMDFCSGGDLSKYAKKMRSEGLRITEGVLAKLMRQLLMAVAHVHWHGLLHLDIKPANVVIVPEVMTMPPAHGPDPTPGPFQALDPAKPLHVMLIDLGLARIFQPGRFTNGKFAGSPATMSPEVWKGVETPAADIFSCGCTFFNLLADQYPFVPPPMSVEEAAAFWANEPQHVEYAAGDVYSPSAYSLCDKMLHQQRLERPTAAQCLQEDFFLDPHSRERVGQKESERLQRLAKAPGRSPLYLSVALAVASSWPAHRLPSIRKAFQELDVAGTGRLQKAQIVSTLISLGVESGTAHKAADAMDLSRDGTVDWTEFVAACIQLGSETLQDDLWELFREADRDKDGLLDRQDIAKLLAVEHLRDEAVDDTMQQLVGQPSAKVDWPTFRRHFASVSASRSCAS